MVSATTRFARVTMTEPTIVCNRPTAGGLTPSCAVATRNMPHPLTLEQIACGVPGAPPLSSYNFYVYFSFVKT